MNPKAVIFGAGNIGRGFIGQLFSESGFSITFVDVDEELVDALNRDGSYHLQTVFNEDMRDYRIGPVRAIHGRDVEAVALALAEAVVGATAVGAGALKFVAPAIARGVELRMAAGAAPLNLIICENLKGAAAAVRALIRDSLTPGCQAYLESHLGLVDTVIGRMVPIPTEEMRARDVSFVRVEPYKELPVDRAGFRGDIPTIAAMEPQDSFPLFTARKLYVHNCGHALLAYTGYQRGHEFGYQALEDPAVRQVLHGGLRESIAGIVHKFSCDRTWLEDHLEDLLQRFANRFLGDTIFGLGRDPLRKLAATDRLVGAAHLALETGAAPRCLAWGIGAALCFDAEDDPGARDMQAVIRDRGVAAALTSITGIDAASELGVLILRAYERLRADPHAEITH